jgi:hypothetical protein
MDDRQAMAAARLLPVRVDTLGSCRLSRGIGVQECLYLLASCQRFQSSLWGDIPLFPEFGCLGGVEPDLGYSRFRQVRVGSNQENAPIAQGIGACAKL